MQRCYRQTARLLAAGALLSLWTAASAQRPAVALDEGPWDYTTFEQGTRIRVSVVARDLAQPWSMAFLPGSRSDANAAPDALITEKGGRVRLLEDGSLRPEPVAELAELLSIDQLFDIALHPDFADNRLVYFTYMKKGDPPDASARYYATTALARGRFDGERITDVEDVFIANGWQTNFGGDASAITFAPDGTIFMTVSHRRVPEPPQDLASHIGKVLRLTDDGKPAPGNPFAGRANALPEIYSYGHRTIMDVLIHPETGAVWELENGPNGGDEVNVIEAGANYGWPIVTYGRDYDGSRPPGRWRQGMRDPEIFWVPSITAASMLFYTGDRFPEWTGHLFVTAMSEGRIPGTGHLQRIVFNENGEIRRERLLTDLRQRIRHISQGPDGLLYLLTDGADAALLRIEPVAEEPVTSQAAPARSAAPAAAAARPAPAAAAQPSASSSQAVLFAEHDCSLCHRVDVGNVGPAFIDIARRYAGQDEEVDRLARTIIEGGIGRWGDAPMTPHPGIDIDEARRLVRTILALGQ